MIIAIQGAHNSGKDEVSKIITSLTPSTIFTLSTPVKSIFNEKYDLIWDKIPRSKKEEYRQNFIQICDNLKKQFDRNYFIEILCNSINNTNKQLNLFMSNQNPYVFIVSDLRFKNEYEYLVNWCRKNNETLKTVNIIRNNDFEYDKIQEDFIIINNSSLEYLKFQIETMLKHFNLKMND